MNEPVVEDSTVGETEWHSGWPDHGRLSGEDMVYLAVPTMGQCSDDKDAGDKVFGKPELLIPNV